MAPTPPAVVVGSVVIVPRISPSRGVVEVAHQLVLGVDTHIVKFGEVSGYLFDPVFRMAVPIAEVAPAICPTCEQDWPK